MTFGREVLAPQYILNGVTATGAGTTINAQNFQNAVVEISSTGTSSFTIKAQGGMGIGNLGNTAPAFGSAKTTANPWDYIEMIDLEDGTAIDGDTGVAFSAADVRLFELNINAMDFTTFNVTARTSGIITVRIRLYTND